MYISKLVCIVIVLSIINFASANNEIEKHKIKFLNSYDLGQILSGDADGTELERQFVTRSSLWAVLGATINERFIFESVLGGFFWHPLPQQAGLSHTRLMKAGAAAAQISGKYSFGEIEEPWGYVQFGLFNHKYNSDSKNLGEYLLRSGTYPGIIWGATWNLMNSSGYQASGIRFHSEHLEGMIKQDFTIYMERDIEPNFDISPSYLVDFNFGNVLTIGGGVTFAHLISVNEDKTTPSGRDFRKNAYANTTYDFYDSVYVMDSLIRIDTAMVTGMTWLPVAEHSKFGYEHTSPYYLDSLEMEDIVARNGDGNPNTNDPRWIGTSLTGGGRFEGTNQYQSYLENGIPESQLSFYTFRGVKLMTKFSLNLQSLIQSELMGPEEMKIYGEVALLGVKDYPYFYENKRDRMPMMFGVNLPVFKLLDMLSVEFEYYKPAFANNAQTVTETTLPTYAGITDLSTYNPVKWKEDNFFWKWSVYGKKNIANLFNLYIQVANDHTRSIFWLGTPNPEPNTNEKEDWYYNFRIETVF